MFTDPYKQKVPVMRKSFCDTTCIYKQIHFLNSWLLIWFELTNHKKQLQKYFFRETKEMKPSSFLFVFLLYPVRASLP